MAAIRYFALVTLVVWTATLLSHVAGDMLAQVDQVTYACAALTLVLLMLLKFMGPPIPAFSLRVILVTLMLLPAVNPAIVEQLHLGSTTGRGVQFGLCMLLLVWHVPE
jgi:hypothetical protein